MCLILPWHTVAEEVLQITGFIRALARDWTYDVMVVYEHVCYATDTTEEKHGQLNTRRLPIHEVESRIVTQRQPL